MGGIGRTQNGTNIARLLDTFQNNYQRGFTQLKTVKGVLLGNDLSNDTLSTATIRHLIIYIGRDLKQTGATNGGLLMAENLWAPEEGVYLIAALQATLYLAPTLHDKQPMAAALLRLLLQLQQQLHLRILST